MRSLPLLCLLFVCVTSTGCGSSSKRGGGATAAVTEAGEPEPAGPPGPPGPAGPPVSPPDAPLTPLQLRGKVALGPVAGATMTAYSLDANADPGVQLGTTATDANGVFSFAISGMPSAAVGLMAADGNYRDEASGRALGLPQNTHLLAYISEATQLQNLAITPLTTMAAIGAQRALQRGEYHAIHAALQASNANVLAALHLAPSFDLLHTVPDDLTQVATPSCAAAGAYGAALGGLSQLLHDNAINPNRALRLIYSLAGAVGGDPAAPSGVQDGNASLSASAALPQFSGAAQRFLQSPANNSNLVLFPTALKAAPSDFAPNCLPQSPNAVSLGGLIGTGTPLQRATVVAYLLDPNDASTGACVASTVSDADGRYSLAVPPGVPLLVRTTNGYTRDVMSGAVLPLPVDMEGPSGMVLDTSLPYLNLSLLSTLIEHKSRALLLGGAPDLASAQQQAEQDVAAVLVFNGVPALGLFEYVDLVRLDQPTGGGDANALYTGALMAGLSQVFVTQGIAPENLWRAFEALAYDFEDGVFDGTPVAPHATLSPSLDGGVLFNALQTGVDDFLASPLNVNTFTRGDITPSNI